MKIVVEKEERTIQPRQVYISTFRPVVTPDRSYSTVMVIEDLGRQGVYERFGLLDLDAGQVVLGWTNEEAIEKYLVQNAYNLMPPDGVELKIRKPR